MGETQQVTPESARRLTDRIKVAVEGTWQLIQEAYVSRAWAALGYASWDEYCTHEFDTSRLALPREERREIVASLRESGLSTRAIGAAVGISEATVRREMPTASSTQENDALETRRVIGLNGKSYAPSRPTSRPMPNPQAPQSTQSEPSMFDDEEVVDGEVVDGEVEGNGGDSCDTPTPRPASVMLTLRTHAGAPVKYPQPQGKATFNETKGDGISWAAWSWNPVTGCLHGCDYCYARAIANRWTDAYPVGFTPLRHAERDDAPANTVIPTQYRNDAHQSCGQGDCKVCAYRRVFVCSMADLYGRWVPDRWIDEVHASMLASPHWEYMLLTKFPARYVGLGLPPKAWVGTSVDEQKRVRIAEDAFRKIDGVRVKWLSLEPLREPLEFTDLSMFDFVVIGAQTETTQPTGRVAAFDPPREWVWRITAQAKEAGCKVHYKPNLRKSIWLDEFPETAAGAP